MESEQGRARARDLRAMVADAVFFSAMVGAGEAYLPAFVLASGLGEITAGLVTTLPLLIGSVFQLVAPIACRQLDSYRRWIVWCVRLQALSFVPLILFAWSGGITRGWLALATVAYWSFGMAAAPAWNAWASSLVPRAIRARFFAHRTRAAQASLLVSMLGAGAALELGRRAGFEHQVFAGLFAAALAFRAASARQLARQSEARGLVASHHTLGPSEVWQRIRAARSTRVLAYLLAMQLCVNLASPYFTPYMLGPLSLSYAEFTLLSAAAFAARIALLPWLGRIAERRGSRSLLWAGALGIAPLPAFWLVSDEFLFLLGLQLASGAAWAALELATLLSFFDGIEERDRASVLTFFNLLNAGAAALGAFCGSRIFAGIALVPEAYAALFVLSAAGRLLTLALLRGGASESYAPPNAAPERFQLERWGRPLPRRRIAKLVAIALWPFALRSASLQSRASSAPSTSPAPGSSSLPPASSGNQLASSPK
jgi:hypothetical protein